MQGGQREQEDEGLDDDDEEEGALAAFGILRALSTVLDGVSTLPGLFPQLEAIVFPILQNMIAPSGLEVFEELMELVSYFTYFPEQVGRPGLCTTGLDNLGLGHVLRANLTR